MFFAIYLFIVVGAIYLDNSLVLTLQKFDLNEDGFFGGDEITTEQRKAMRDVISDTAKTFSYLTGLVYSGIIAFLVCILGKITEYKKT